MTEAEKIQMEIKQKEAEVLGLKKKLEEEQKRECEMYKRWTPKRGEIYYYILCTGVVTCTAWEGGGNDFDNTCYNFYNMFETKEAAETARDNIKMTLQYCQLLLLPVVKDIPDKACIKTDYLIGTGLTSEVKAKLRELIKAGF